MYQLVFLTLSLSHAHERSRARTRTRTRTRYLSSSHSLPLGFSPAHRFPRKGVGKQPHHRTRIASLRYIHGGVTEFVGNVHARALVEEQRCYLPEACFGFRAWGSGFRVAQRCYLPEAWLCISTRGREGGRTRAKTVCVHTCIHARIQPVLITSKKCSALSRWP